MAGGVEVWTVDLDGGLPALLQLEAAYGLLADEDRDRVARLPDRGEADRRLAAVVALRALLVGRGVIEARGGPFAREPAGKPFFPSSGRHFSLSHTTGLALIAIAPRPVGIDVESPRPVDLGADRLARIERAAGLICAHAPLRAGPPRMRALQAWTRLEALAKADGRGIAWLLSEIAALGPRRTKTTAQEVEVAIGRLAQRFTTEDIPLEGHHPAAVSIEGARESVSVTCLPMERTGLQELMRCSPDLP